MANADSTTLSTQGAEASILDRDTASKFNPLIGMCATETIERCDCILSDIGYVMSGAQQQGMAIDVKDWYLMFEVAHSAMRYEIQTMKQGAIA